MAPVMLVRADTKFRTSGVRFASRQSRVQFPPSRGAGRFPSRKSSARGSAAGNYRLNPAPAGPMMPWDTGLVASLR